MCEMSDFNVVLFQWVSEGDSPGRVGVPPVRIENPNQFAPQGDNPKEFKEKQKSVSLKSCG